MQKKRGLKSLTKIILIFFLTAQFSGLSLFFPKKTKSGTLTSVSATLGNSRLSFYGKVSGQHTAGATTITLDTSDNADNNNYHLFPGDPVAIGVNGGLTVARVIDDASDNKFVISSPLTVTVADQTPVYSTQSGSLVVQFTLANAIPANGYVLITIPDASSNQNDGAPDTEASIANNGFDANGIGTDDWSITGGTGCTWGTETWTVGSGSGHTYKVVTTTACTGGTITATLDASPGLVNPAPVTSGHSQGTADTYTITVATYDSSDVLIDTADTKVAPVEAVLVSATIEETISFSVAGIAGPATVCGKPQAASITTTAMSVPFGSLSAPNIATAAQTLTVSTNATHGYKVKIEENDQLSIDGLGTTTIADTICDAGTCTHSTSGEWKTGYNVAKGAFGYSLENVSGSDAAFTYNESSRYFSAKQLPENGVDFTPPATSPETIMSNNSPVAGSQIRVCYMLAIQGTQEAGYYFNKVRYTATPIF